MLIRGASMLRDGGLLRDMDIAIEGGQIVQIGEKLKAEDDLVIDAKKMLAIPGLVNAHTHLAMTLFRGYADDMELMPWLQEKIWPLEARLKEEDIRWGVKLGCLEMIRMGITCYNDMYYFMDETARATKEMGLRAFLAGVIFDMHPEFLREAEPFIQRWKGDDLIRPTLGPHAIYTCSEETLIQVREIAKRHEVPVHIHLSETRGEVDTFVNQRKMTPVEYMDSLDLLGPDLIAVHCIWLSPRDITLLAKSKTTVVHTPVSNLKLASGIAPIDRLLQEGACVCLGTDGASSNNSLSIFQEMKTAAITQKNVWGPTTLRAEQVWRIATENAYRAFGLNMGLREGALADLVLIDLRRPWFWPATNMHSHLVYSMMGGVDTVIVNGRVLMRHGQIPGEEEIIERAQKQFLDLTSR